VLNRDKSKTTVASRFDSGDLRDRVRLFVLVLLAIDLLAHVSDLLTPLLIDGYELPAVPRSMTVMRFVQTFVLCATWLLMKRIQLGARAIAWIEAAVTLWVVFAYVFIGNLYQPGGVTWFGTVFSLFGVLLLLNLRAALIPSSVTRTLLIGALSVAIYFVIARDNLATLASAALEGLAFLGGAFVVAMSVTSRVIYGLRIQVQDARELGQYILVERLGRGGMGEVYLARHRLLRRSTAIKLLPPEMSSEKAITRFESEVQLTAELTHPHTIRIFDYGRTDDGIFYYAMEHLKGATLNQVVQADGPQPPGRVLKVLEEACGALEEAHDAGLIHRDIKPANMMLTKQGMDPDALKVLDFGLVSRRDREPNAGVTQADALVGTPLYMAPEVIQKAGAASAASDLYALGAVGYFLATGTDVFSGANVVETCAHHLHSTPERPSERLGQPLAQDFEDVILKCLAKDPAARFQDARALLMAVRRCADFGTWSRQDAQAWWSRCGQALSQEEESLAGQPRALTVAAADLQHEELAAR